MATPRKPRTAKNKRIVKEVLKRARNRAGPTPRKRRTGKKT